MRIVSKCGTKWSGRDDDGDDDDDDEEEVDGVTLLLAGKASFVIKKNNSNNKSTGPRGFAVKRASGQSIKANSSRAVKLWSVS